ncbi:hypothetical protein DPMN_121071 [Dreissena polymorpha]|uniref:Uncharacterized protein n=1 Tax=Dreissena polymorpha TaxID=45954 RepID=A0A9D4GM31_DREPO|nr:hypothetical protein DPMN_121071 [Dreissena polymorpha]
MAPVTGLKNRPKVDFDAYMGKLHHEAAGIVYNRKMGNPDFAEYDTRKIDPMTGDGGIPTIDPPAIPGQIFKRMVTIMRFPPSCRPDQSPCQNHNRWQHKIRHMKTRNIKIRHRQIRQIKIRQIKIPNIKIPNIKIRNIKIRNIKIRKIKNRNKKINWQRRRRNPRLCALRNQSLLRQYSHLLPWRWM